MTDFLIQSQPLNDRWRNYGTAVDWRVAHSLYERCRVIYPWRNVRIINHRGYVYCQYNIGNPNNKEESMNPCNNHTSDCKCRQYDESTPDKEWTVIEKYNTLVRGETVRITERNGDQFVGQVTAFADGRVSSEHHVFLQANVTVEAMRYHEFIPSEPNTAWQDKSGTLFVTNHAGELRSGGSGFLTNTEARARAPWTQLLPAKRVAKRVVESFEYLTSVGSTPAEALNQLRNKIESGVDW